MALTQERINEIAEFINVDEAKANQLFEMTPEDAAVQMTNDGFAVTADEIKEMGEILTSVSANGELSEDDLDNVSGGVMLMRSLDCVSLTTAWIIQKRMW